MFFSHPVGDAQFAQQQQQQEEFAWFATRICAASRLCLRPHLVAHHTALRPILSPLSSFICHFACSARVMRAEEWLAICCISKVDWEMYAITDEKNNNNKARFTQSIRRTGFSGHVAATG
jgi:hypothetical protein